MNFFNGTKYVVLQVIILGVNLFKVFPQDKFQVFAATSILDIQNN